MDGAPATLETVDLPVEKDNKTKTETPTASQKAKKVMDKALFKMTKQMAYRPVLWCSCCCSFILFVVVIALFTGLASFTTSSEYDWVIASTQESKNSDALSDAIDRVDPLDVTSARQETYDQNLFFLFDLKAEGDLYQAQYLKSMCMVESAVALDKEYPKFCRLDDSGECTLPGTSVVVYFYDFTTIDSWNCTLLDDSVIEAKKNTIYDAMSTAEGREEYGLWLDRDAPEKGFTGKCNSLWSFGAPLDGYNSTTDDEADQLEKYQKFLADVDGSVGGVEETLFDYFDFEANEDSVLQYYPTPYMEKASEPGLGVMFYSNLLSDNETVRLLTTDLFFAIFSIMFVLFWLRMHTNSTFIALLGMYMIFCSLPFSLALYRGLYDIPFFSQLHSLVLFIVLGVGADDVFVLVDSWRATEHMFPGDISNGANKKIVHQRLHHCYKHTMETVFNTSFTTAMAFIATGFSPLMPIATFGWYAATCIVCNYIFVITLMPMVVVIADSYFRNYIPCTKYEPKPNDDPDVGFVPQAEQGSVLDENEHERRSSLGEHDKLEMADKLEKNGSHRELNGSTNGAGAGHYAVVVSEEDKLKTDKNGTILGAAGGGDTVQIEGLEMVTKNQAAASSSHKVVLTSDDEGSTGADTDTPELHKRELEFKPNVVVEGYIKFMSYSIYFDKEKLRPIPIVAITIVLILLVYGIVGVIYGLALTPPTSQESWFPTQHMFTLSQTAITEDYLSSSENAYANLELTFGISGIDRGGFNIYIPDENRGDVKFDDKWDLALPACQKVMVRMCDDVEEYECKEAGCGSSKKLARFNTTECFMRDFRSWMNTGFGVDTYDMTSADFYGNLSKFRDTQFQKYDTYSTWQNRIGFIDGKLEFGSVGLITTMEASSEMVIKEDVLDVINNFVSKVKDYEECNECSCGTLQHTSDFAFVWLRTEQGLVEGFYQGVIIAFPVAFVVLLFATGNVVISIYAIVTVFFIVFGVLGFANYALHWNLGIAESIAGIIIIGFAVDYTVHLGHMYTTGEHVGLTDRRAQFEFASRKIAMTIVGGAITTVGAGVFMFACQLVFFQKMAALIVCTILMSYTYSLGFFMAVLYTIGPERNCGKLSVVYAYINGILNKDKSQEDNKIDNTKIEQVGGNELPSQ